MATQSETVPSLRKCSLARSALVSRSESPARYESAVPHPSTRKFHLRRLTVRSAKNCSMFFQQFLGQLFVALRECAVAHHVGEHDRGQFALLLGGHLFTAGVPCGAEGRQSVGRCEGNRTVAPT